MGWSYFNSPRQRQKSTEEVLELLNTCAKMNANVLLNIGPRPNGIILEENVKTLKEVGDFWINMAPEIEYNCIFAWLFFVIPV